MRLGGLEAGGTEWACGVGDESGRIDAWTTFPTTTPTETLLQAAAFFRDSGPVDALGIGAFGPLDIRPGSPAFGHITATPKHGWSNVDVLAPMRAALGVPVALETDVNAAALGEATWGNGDGVATFAYITVGTGIGGGIIADGRLLHGLLHPELGHMRIPHDRVRDPFEGCCPFHGDCLEGLASGEAIRRRTGSPAERLTDDSVWELEVEYLAAALSNVTYLLSPERIIVGGGVVRRPDLLPRVRRRVSELIAGYPAAPGVQERLEGERYIVEPGLGDRAGVVGAIELARHLASRNDFRGPGLSA